MVFNFYSYNIIFYSSHSTLTKLLNLPPNAAILDVIVGYSLIIYSTLNLIQIYLKPDLKSLNIRAIYFQITHIINSLGGGVIAVGIIFQSAGIISIGIVLIIIAVTYIALKIPIK